jgi:hypothetical protein
MKVMLPILAVPCIVDKDPNFLAAVPDRDGSATRIHHGEQKLPESPLRAR